MAGGTASGTSRRDRPLARRGRAFVHDIADTLKGHSINMLAALGSMVGGGWESAGNALEAIGGVPPDALASAKWLREKGRTISANAREAAKRGLLGEIHADPMTGELYQEPTLRPPRPSRSGRTSAITRLLGAAIRRRLHAKRMWVKIEELQ